MKDEKKLEKVEEISRERHKENLEREIKSYTKNIKEHKELLERLRNERDIIKKRFEIMRKPENFVIVNPIWKYESDPEYVKTLMIENENQEKQINFQLDQNEQQIIKTIELQEKALESVKEEAERIKGEKKNE